MNRSRPAGSTVSFRPNMTPHLEWGDRGGDRDQWVHLHWSWTAVRV